MLFNSIEFVIFLPIVFILYWFVFRKSRKAQNILLLIASYFFYGWWDWRFLFLILFSSILDFYIGLELGKTEKIKKRKILIFLSLFFNLGFLGFFKYYNFFIDSFIELFANFGITMHASSLQIILPVGISFYTFQTLSYSLDIYFKKLEPTRDPITFFTFVSFFPQLVAGPIERAKNLLPQFEKNRKFNLHDATDGMRQILWGLIKKVLIADTCAKYVNEIFGNYSDHNGLTLLLGAFYFAFQIYGDFSGYSDIAIGTSKLFGFNLMRNFAFPYFSRDIAEFWRRWHISLSTWFRDYLYIPLGGSRGGTSMKIRNTFIIFIVSGFWHGANWTFIVWGALNAIYYLPLMLSKKNRTNLDTVAENKFLPSFREFFQILSTFILTLFAWIFFRAQSVNEAFEYIVKIISGFNKGLPNIDNLMFLPVITIFILIEWIYRMKEHPLQNIKSPLFIRWSVYLILGFILIMLFNSSPNQFIYFQF